jgi:hypothetical protein
MKKLFLLTLLFLPACSTGIPLQNYNDHPAAPESFMLCHGYSCTHKSKAGFTKGEWQKIAALFPATNSEMERAQIGRALALMEQYAGAKTGTNIDDEAAVGRKANIYQLDCIDETVNTTHYLTFLENAGLLKFHAPADPTHRGYLIDGRWPHNTAVIKETKTGALWAVDSFYRKNGEEPYIVLRADWLAGWRPPGATQ